MYSLLNLTSVIAARTAIVLIFLIVGFRVFGKRQLGQINIYDLAMIMLIANAVQNAMTEGKGALAVGIASSATLLIVGIAFTTIVARKAVFARLVTGSPTVLVSQGQFIPRNLRREGVTQEQVLAAGRENELNSLDRIQLAILEVDGDISIIPVAVKSGR